MDSQSEKPAAEFDRGGAALPSLPAEMTITMSRCPAMKSSTSVESLYGARR